MIGVSGLHPVAQKLRGLKTLMEIFFHSLNENLPKLLIIL